MIGRIGILEQKMVVNRQEDVHIVMPRKHARHMNGNGNICLTTIADK
jgi:hypothetical protein